MFHKYHPPLTLPEDAALEWDILLNPYKQKTKTLKQKYNDITFWIWETMNNNNNTQQPTIETFKLEKTPNRYRKETKKRT